MTAGLSVPFVSSVKRVVPVPHSTDQAVGKGRSSIGIGHVPRPTTVPMGLVLRNPESRGNQIAWRGVNKRISNEESFLHGTMGGAVVNKVPLKSDESIVIWLQVTRIQGTAKDMGGASVAKDSPIIKGWLPDTRRLQTCRWIRELMLGYQSRGSAHCCPGKYSKGIRIGLRLR